MVAEPPEGLGNRGTRMWEESLAAWELTAGHQILLGEACRIADRLEDLDELIQAAALDFAAAGPVLAESRQQAGALQRILAEVRQGARPLAAPKQQQGGSGVASIADQVAKRRAQAQAGAGSAG